MPSSAPSSCGIGRAARSRTPLGVGKNAHLFPGQPPQERGVWFLKSERGLDGAVAGELLSSYEKPHVLTAPTVANGYGGYSIHVETLAWGVTRMLRNVFDDDEQATLANNTARELLRLH